MHRQVVGCKPHGQMVGCEPHGQMVGAVGAVGGVKRGKLCQSLGTLTKFIVFFN